MSLLDTGSLAAPLQVPDTPGAARGKTDEKAGLLPTCAKEGLGRGIITMPDLRKKGSEAQRMHFLGGKLD